LKYTSSQENYLKAIYHLQNTGDSATTNGLADSMRTSAASVTDMLKKLREQKLLLYERYKGFRLTQEGRKVAVQIIRKHRLWEYFLVEKLMFEWDEVHDMAEELEHVSSKKLIERLDAYLNFPQSDPHGDPIPDGQGKFSIQHQVKLADLPLNKAAHVSCIASQTKEMLDLLRQKNIRIGTRLEIRKKYDYDHSVELRIRNQSPVTLSEMVSKNIWVKNEE
jgi:DtxR family Mn-dependent transcriptional regulator